MGLPHSNKMLRQVDMCGRFCALYDMYWDVFVNLDKRSAALLQRWVVNLGFVALKPEVLVTERNTIQQLGIGGHVQTRGVMVEARKFQKAQRSEECEGFSNVIVGLTYLFLAFIYLYTVPCLNFVYISLNTSQLLTCFSHTILVRSVFL